MSNLAAMGFGHYSPGQNAFQACVPRSIIAGERQSAKQRAQLKAKATRVSKYTERATPAQAQAASDKTRQIQASSNRYRTS